MLLSTEDREFLRELRSYYGPDYDRGRGNASFGGYQGSGHWENKARWKMSAAGILRVYDRFRTGTPELVLELGCGTGAMTRELRSLGIRAYGLDWGGNIRDEGCVVADATRLPFAVKFDLVIALDLVEHMPFDLQDALFSELRRVAADVLVVTVPASRPYFANGRLSGYRNHYMSLSPETWEEHFLERGFVAEAQGAELFPYGPPFAWGNENYPFIFGRRHQ